MVKGSVALARVRSFRTKSNKEFSQNISDSPTSIVVSECITTEVEPNRHQSNAIRGQPLPNEQNSISLFQDASTSEPEHSFRPPRETIPEQRNSNTLRLPRLQLQSQGNFVEESLIGMALGSPSQGPFPALPESGVGIGPSFVDSKRGSTPSSHVWTSEPHSVEDAIKLKGRWKMFGGIFGKKGFGSPTSPSTPFYQLQLSPSPLSDHDSQGSPTQSHSRGARGLRHHVDSTNATGDATKKKLRSRKDPQLEMKSGIVRTKSTPLFSSARKSPTPPPKDPHPLTESSKSSRNGKPMMLQVDIPDVAMERYSIMFGAVLEQGPPSLITRRQGPLERLKALDTNKHQPPEYSTSSQTQIKPARRATSPSPRSRSPCFSLFPTASSDLNRAGHSPLNGRAMPLARSATAPGSVSPARATFDLTKSWSPQRDSHEHIPSIQRRTSDGEDINQNIEGGNTPVPPEIANSGNPSPLVINGALTPPQSAESPPSHGPSLPSNPRPEHHPLRQSSVRISPNPEFHTIHSPPKTPNSADHAPSTHKTLYPTSQALDIRPRASSQAPRPPPKSTPSPNFHNPLSSAPPSAAEISIARSISVSRRQEQLLVPITPKTARQPRRATVVDVAKEGMGHVSRKSQHLIVEEV